MGGYGLDLSGSGQGPVEDFEHSTEHSGSIEAGNFFTSSVTVSFLRRIYTSVIDQNANVHVVWQLCITTKTHPKFEINYVSSNQN
jgi:hypothetical protein